jgi:hypothetical protein
MGKGYQFEEFLLDLVLKPGLHIDDSHNCKFLVVSCEGRTAGHQGDNHTQNDQ